MDHRRKCGNTSAANLALKRHVGAVHPINVLYAARTLILALPTYFLIPVLSSVEMSCNEHAIQQNSLNLAEHFDICSVSAFNTVVIVTPVVTCCTSHL